MKLPGDSFGRLINGSGRESGVSGVGIGFWPNWCPPLIAVRLECMVDHRSPVPDMRYSVILLSGQCQMLLTSAAAVWDELYSGDRPSYV